MPASFGPFLSITVEGHRDLLGRFARATTAVTTARREEMRSLGRMAVKALQAEAPVRTGRLKRGIRYNTRESGRNVTLRITSEAPYTQFVIQGRRGFSAKNARALRFVINGTVLYRKRVGPAKANPFHRRAFQSLQAAGEPRKTANRMAVRIKSAFSGR